MPLSPLFCAVDVGETFQFVTGLFCVLACLSAGLYWTVCFTLRRFFLAVPVTGIVCDFDGDGRTGLFDGHVV